MLLTVKQTADMLGLRLNQIDKIYYALYMGYIEGIRIGGTWRLVPESVKAYGKGKAV